MKLTLVTIMVLLALMGCSSNPSFKPEPVKYKAHKLKDCGVIKYTIKENKIIMDKKATECLKENLITCCKDKQSLEIANEANIEIIELLERDDVLEP